MVCYQGSGKGFEGESIVRWQLAGDWPVGSLCIPAGTMLEGEAPVWNGSALPLPLPLNAVPQDVEAALVTLKAYSEELWHLIVFARGIDREAILREGLQHKRWPNGPPPPKAEEKPAGSKKAK
jgi:hypothetical protein